MALRRHRDLRLAWTAAHHLTGRLLAGIAGCWLALGLFTAVTIPLKYPFEARGTVIDTGVVVGLVLPLAVMGTALDEGPDDLVRSAARSLGVIRAAVAFAFLGTALGAAAAAALIAGLPVRLVQVDTLLLAALTLLGTSLLGARRGWILTMVTVLVVSAPGLVPWNLNVLYHRDVGTTFLLATLATSVVAVTTYAARGSVGLGRPR